MLSSGIAIPNFGPSSLGAFGRLGAFASGAFPAANATIYMPFRINRVITIATIEVMNGATVSGNVDVGIYDEGQRRVVNSGSTGQAGTNAAQSFNITDTPLGPGLFYMALACDNTSATFIRAVVPVYTSRPLGMAQQASAFPLPDPSVMALMTVTFLPIMSLKCAL